MRRMFTKKEIETLIERKLTTYEYKYLVFGTNLEYEDNEANYYIIPNFCLLTKEVYEQDFEECIRLAFKYSKYGYLMLPYKKNDDILFDIFHENDDNMQIGEVILSTLISGSLYVLNLETGETFTHEI